MSKTQRFLISVLAVAAIAATAIWLHDSQAATIQSKTTPVHQAPLRVQTDNPILFVTQVPWTGAFTILSAFSNQKAEVSSAPPGGDLMILYPDNQLRNLTREAGFGTAGADQRAAAIRVRDPAVSYDGTKALFSMAVGAPSRQYDTSTTYHWQLYEITGIGEGQTAVATHIAAQPSNCNNIDPAYAPDGGILFTSDQPRAGGCTGNLYPQIDEYESRPIITGIWKIPPGGGTATQLTDDPSGAFNPMIDSFGRILFTRWDHLQRDQQCDGGESNCRTYASEAPGAALVNGEPELFPEPRVQGAGGNVFNIFGPWSVNQDGTSEETLNHIGRHELQSFFYRSIPNDPAIVDFSPGNRTNHNAISNFLQLAEDPTHPGTYYGIDAPEFGTDAAGQIISIIAIPHVAADTLSITYVSPHGNHDRFRRPAILASGQVIASYTTASGDDANVGQNPMHTLYDFRLRNVNAGVAAGYVVSTAGIQRSVNWWSPDVQMSYNGPLWELSPVEVRARPLPPTTATTLEPPELAAFQTAGVDPVAFETWLTQHNLAVIVSRNVTSRDDADRQQPYNLSVPGGVTTVGNSGHVYSISDLQLFEGDANRGMTDRLGHRKLAEFLNDPASLAANPPLTGAPPASVSIAPDGSAAAFVPADRSMAWQTTAADGTPVVRERMWISLRPGEIRACDSCHGTNTLNQAGQPPPQNTPAALVALLDYWSAQQGGQCTNPQPDQTPLCPDGSHETGGTWVESPFPACVWTYINGVCPILPVYTITITQGTQSHDFPAANGAPNAIMVAAAGSVPQHWRVTQGATVFDYATAADLDWHYHQTSASPATHGAIRIE